MEHEVMYQRDVSTATCFRWESAEIRMREQRKLKKDLSTEGNRRH